MSNSKDNLLTLVANAVAAYWEIRLKQQSRQRDIGNLDQGARSSVTGGAQMIGFINLLADLIEQAGIESKYIYKKKSLELPGYFRPTKEWDLLVVREGKLIVALEAKSQVGPSFGNNFNNRTEEAMGSALDLWTAFREGAFKNSMTPFLGYFFMLEDAPGSKRPVRTKEPHFPVFPEFKDTSYAKRYELFCRKLVRERHYSAAAFIMSNAESDRRGSFLEPSLDLAVDAFVRMLIAHVTAHRN